jgi:hypothetical protein
LEFREAARVVDRPAESPERVSLGELVDREPVLDLHPEPSDPGKLFAELGLALDALSKRFRRELLSCFVPLDLRDQ